MIEQMLFTLFCTVFFCLGLTLTSQEGYALYFIRKPFDLAYEKHEQLQQLRHIGWRLYYYNFVYQFSKPIILCITCMGSIWGVTWFILLNGFSLHVLPYIVINCFASAFIQTFIWKLYAKINI